MKRWLARIYKENEELKLEWNPDLSATEIWSYFERKVEMKMEPIEKVSSFNSCDDFYKKLRESGIIIDPKYNQIQEKSPQSKPHVKTSND